MQHKKQITLPNRVAEKASAVVKKEGKSGFFFGPHVVSATTP